MPITSSDRQSGHVGVGEMDRQVGDVVQRGTAGDSPPSRMWICCRAMVMPMPASIACTTIGEIASAARPSLVTPKMICSRPAQTVIAQVTAQPNWATSAVTITVNLAGPLT